jgi:5-methylcytosine-specific restriction endonuclease McrA
MATSTLPVDHTLNGDGKPHHLHASPDLRLERRGGTGGRVLVLNASYEPINVCTVRRAAVLILKERAEILESHERELHSESLTIPRPAVIRLTTYVRIPRDAHSRKITRRAIFARDRWTCQYCGSPRASLTVDHVIPRSKGGMSSWDNIVTCCAPCNRRKADRLPKQAGMHPREKPRAPGPSIFVHVAVTRVPDVWQQYLAAA